MFVTVMCQNVMWMRVIVVLIHHVLNTSLNVSVLPVHQLYSLHVI